MLSENAIEFGGETTRTREMLIIDGIARGTRIGATASSESGMIFILWLGLHTRQFIGRLHADF
jgi:hypothetical protein